MAIAFSSSSNNQMGVYKVEVQLSKDHSTQVDVNSTKVEVDFGGEYKLTQIALSVVKDGKSSSSGSSSLSVVVNTESTQILRTVIDMGTKMGGREKGDDDDDLTGWSSVQKYPGIVREGRLDTLGDLISLQVTTSDSDSKGTSSGESVLVWNLADFEESKDLGRVYSQLLIPSSGAGKILGGYILEKGGNSQKKIVRADNTSKTSTLPNILVFGSSQTTATTSNSTKPALSKYGVGHFHL